MRLGPLWLWDGGSVLLHQGQAGGPGDNALGPLDKPYLLGRCLEEDISKVV